MKLFRKKNISFITFFFIFISLQSCSWLGKRQALFDKNSSDTKPSSVAGSKEMVTKDQYDQLLNKYEGLLSKIKVAETTSVENNSKMQSSLNSSDIKMPKAIVDESKLISQLSKITPKADLAETVDVFGKGGLVSKDILESGKPPERNTLTDLDIQNQLQQLQKANRLVKNNKVDSALILLKELEESSNRHIRVRAKFYLAEMLFRQNEYDLALQMYEEIVHKNAFSGLVINSLGRLIVCSEKLKLKKKQQRYYSILHDFFES